MESPFSKLRLQLIKQDNLFSAIDDFNQMKNKQTAVALCTYGWQSSKCRPFLSSSRHIVHKLYVPFAKRAKFFLISTLSSAITAAATEMMIMHKSYANVLFSTSLEPSCFEMERWLSIWKATKLRNTLHGKS